MQLHHQHRWDVTPKEAIAIQQQLRGEVKLAGPYDRDHPPETVAGVDVGFEAANTITRAAVVVLDFPSLEPIEHAVYREPTRFPYVPGLLSFREIPAVLGAMEKLKNLPDLLLCDGQGIAHPRRMGIASHLGLLTGIPSIGVGKSRLIGSYEEPGEEKGSWSSLLEKGEVIGAVVRTRSNTKPLYISPGYGIDLESAIYFVLACTKRYKLPETTREAHNLASSK